MSTALDNSTCVAVAAAAPLSIAIPPSPLLNATPFQSSNQPKTKDHQIPRPRNNNNHHANNNNQHRNKRGRKRGKQPPPPVGCSVCKIAKENEPPKYKCPKCRATYCSVICCRKHKEICPGKPGICTPATNSTSTTTTQTATTATESQPTNAAVTELSSDTDYSSGDDDSSLEDGWEITDDMKVALRNSTWLRTELQDGGLRDMIASVVRSERKYKSHHKRQRNHRNPRHKHGGRNNYHQQQMPKHPHEELGAKRQENQNFDVFMDKLLVLADVLERQEEPMDFESGTAGATSGRNEEELEEWLRCKWDPRMPPPSLALKARKKTIPKFEPVDHGSSSSSEDEEEER